MEAKQRKVAIGAAGLVLLLAAGGTYAATRGSGREDRQAFLNDVAKRLHVTPERLQSALRGALADRLHAAVAAGRLTRAQADAIEKRATERGGPPPFLGGPPRLGGHPPFLPGGPPGRPFRAGIEAAAKYLRLSRGELRSKLESGKSLADVARDRGKSLRGLKQAIEGAIREQLDSAVAQKRLTKEEQQRFLSGLDHRIDAIVDRGGEGPGRFRDRPGFGFGERHWGHRWDEGPPAPGPPAP